MSIVPSYIDPGTGSVVFQAVIGVLAAVLVVIVVPVAIIVLVVRRNKGRQKVVQGTPFGFRASCGQPLKERTSFCSHCGAAVNPTEGQEK